MSVHIDRSLGLPVRGPARGAGDPVKHASWSAAIGHMSVDTRQVSAAARHWSTAARRLQVIAGHSHREVRVTKRFPGTAAAPETHTKPRDDGIVAGLPHAAGGTRTPTGCPTSS
jgi:hypothetical protein